MSPLAVLAVQPSLFPYFHVRNNEIYSRHFDANWSPHSGSGYIEELQFWCLLKSKIVICEIPKWKKKFHGRYRIPKVESIIIPFSSPLLTSSARTGAPQHRSIINFFHFHSVPAICMLHKSTLLTLFALWGGQQGTKNYLVSRKN